MAKHIKMGDPNQELSTLPDKRSIDEGHVSDVVDLELPPLLRDLSPEELDACEKRLLRKIDLRLLPPLIIIYIMNYLDRYTGISLGLLRRTADQCNRNAIGSARLGGLEDDLGLKGSEYQVSLCSSSPSISSTLTREWQSRRACRSCLSVTFSCRFHQTCSSTRSANRRYT